MKKKRVIMARKCTFTDGHEFDLEFWDKVGVQGKLAAAWQMVCDLSFFNKKYAPQQRLQRSVAIVQRGRG